MRPRVFPAEDHAAARAHGHAGQASMRPRVFPAERPRAFSRPVAESLCFNEAAGIPRGRPILGYGFAPVQQGFNEAAGIPRGRHKEEVVSQASMPPASMRPRVFPAEDKFFGSNWIEFDTLQ